MIQLPEQLISNYNHSLERRNIAVEQQGDFHKWLLYFLVKIR